MLKIWDCRLPKKALSTVKNAHSAKITSLDWKTSNDLDLLLSAGQLSNIKTWANARTNPKVLCQSKSTFSVAKALFTPYNDLIVYTSQNCVQVID
jgi:WD40 repeat protein